MATLLGNNMSIQDYLKEKKFNPEDPKDVNLFRWELAMQYGIEYQKYLKEEVSDEQIQLERKLIVEHNVPEEMIEYIELFCQLDKEHKEREHKIQNKNHRNRYVKWIRPKPIKDITWRGYWMKATGNDFSIYIHWLKAGIKDERYKTEDFINVYLEERPEAKDISGVPYCVKVANQIFQKYYRT